MFSCVLPGNPSSFVKKEVSNFIQPCFLLIVLCYGCYGTYLIANIFEFIYEIHLYDEGGLIDLIFVVHMANNYLGSQKIKTKPFFNYAVVCTILLIHCCFWVEFVIFYVIWLRTSLNNFQKNLILCVDSLLNFTVANIRMFHIARWSTNNASVL